jgi:hypothetical protein
VSSRWLLSIIIEPPNTVTARSSVSHLATTASDPIVAAQHGYPSGIARQYPGLLIVLAPVRAFAEKRSRAPTLDGAAMTSHTLLAALPNR